MTGILLSFVGLVLTINSSRTEKIIRELIRSNKAAIFLLSIGLFWFLYHHVQNLGEADFGIQGSYWVNWNIHSSSFIFFY